MTGAAMTAALACFAIRPQAQVPPPVQAAVPAQTPTPTVTPTPTPTPTPAVPAGPADYVFTTGAGLVFYYVKSAKAADFETILGRIKEALTKAESPMLKQQALNWKIYKSAEPATDATVFVFAFDPAITTANYDPLLVLSQVLPAEVQPLFDRIKEAVIKVERMGLTKIR
ncbi:MAG TPA: hypothetical protein VMZ90_05865 [Vicinamibacterales bacterium]|nr:hypothetical protein [Vicinamibacterales bacterium]